MDALSVFLMEKEDHSLYDSCMCMCVMEVR